MKLVVGLGNPGRKYEHTRHNVGYAVVAELARRAASCRPRQRFQGEVVEAELGGVRTLLLCPATYMNRSGKSVAEARDFYKLPLEDMLVICDDLNLPLGKLRFRAAGSSGGHKGLDDIIRALGSERFARLRIGIGQVPQGWDAADYVLARFADSEKACIHEAIARAAEAVADWACRGIEYCMNRYN